MTCSGAQVALLLNTEKKVEIIRGWRGGCVCQCVCSSFRCLASWRWHGFSVLVADVRPRARDARHSSQQQPKETKRENITFQIIFFSPNAPSFRSANLRSTNNAWNFAETIRLPARLTAGRAAAAAAGAKEWMRIARFASPQQKSEEKTARGRCAFAGDKGSERNRERKEHYIFFEHTHD